MELRQLKHIVAIARHGSLGRAAAATSISEPGLSKSLAKLEADLGVQLFDRGSKGISPTIYGRSVLQRAEAVLGEIETIRREVDELRGGDRGTVRVGMRPSFGTAYLPHAVARIMRSRKDIKAVLREGIMPTLISELLQGHLDFIVVTELEELDRNLVQEYIADSPVKVLARRDHELAGSASPPLAELAKLNWVMPLSVDPIRRYISDIMNANRMGPVKVVMETNSVIAMKNFVRETNCLTFYPVHLYSPSDDADLTFLDVPELLWKRRLNIVRRRLTSLPPAANLLMKEIRALKLESY